MFERVQGFLGVLFSDMQSTFITLFAIGILICTMGVASGDEQSASKFKSGIKISGVGLVVFLLAKPIIEYVQTNL